MKEYISNSLIEHNISILPQLIFEVTDACNLKCRYCGYGEYYCNHDERKNQFLSEKKAIRLLEYLKLFWESNRNTSYSQQTTISFYGGEPLLNVTFIKHVISYIEKLQLPAKFFTFSMTTNAMLLDKYIDYLVDKKFQLLISLDGTAINHSYRVDHINRNSFHQVVKNIKLLRQKYPDYFNTNVNFNAVLHNRNSVAETFNFIKNEFGKKPNITELNTTGIRMEKRDLFWESYRNKKESLHQAKNFKDIEKEMFMDSPSIRELCLFLHQYSGNVFRTYNDIIISKKEKEVLPTGTCMPFERKMYVTVNGKILPCERIGHQFSLGNVTDTEVFLDIENIAHRYNSWFQKLSAQCTQCFNTQACIQCMFFIDNLDDKPVCRGFMSEKAFHKYVSAQFSYLKEHPYLYKEIMEDIILQ